MSSLFNPPTRTPLLAVDDTMTVAGHMGLAATKKLYLDGIAMTGDTYIVESSANVYSVVVAGTERLKIDGNGIISILGRERLVVASDTNVAANKDNYNPTGLAGCNFLLLTPTGGSRNITGIVAGADGDVIYVSNQSTTQNLVLKYEDGASTGVNRFTTPGSADATITPLKTAMLYYGSNRWNVALFA